MRAFCDKSIALVPNADMARIFHSLTRSLVLVSLAGTLASIVSACSEDSPSGVGSADAGAPSADGGSSSADAGSDGGDGDSLPGDPPNSAAAVRVKIDGVERSFDGPATWTKFNIDGGMVDGFQTNARSANGWILLLSLFSTTPGTYTCETNSSGGLSLSRSSDDGSDRTTFGGYVGKGKCTITLTAHGPKKGDHVSGTFSGELELTEGDYPDKKLVLTDGTFDLVQFADTPSQ